MGGKGALRARRSDERPRHEYQLWLKQWTLRPSTPRCRGRCYSRRGRGPPLKAGGAGRRLQASACRRSHQARPGRSGGGRPLRVRWRRPPRAAAAGWAAAAVAAAGRVAAAAAAADLEPPPLLIGRRSNAPRPTPPPRGRCASRSCLTTSTCRDGRSRRPARYALMCIARWTVAQPRHTCTVHELRVRVHTACVCAPHVHRMCTACAPHVRPHLRRRSSNTTTRATIASGRCSMGQTASPRSSPAPSRCVCSTARRHVLKVPPR